MYEVSTDGEEETETPTDSAPDEVEFGETPETKPEESDEPVTPENLVTEENPVE